jgi:sporulation protein YlmC with PRC-barrel domain
MKTRGILTTALIATSLQMHMVSASAQSQSEQRRNRQEQQQRNRQQRQGARDHQLGSALQANAVIGRDVVGQNGNPVGKIEDAIVDLESGRILFMVVDLEGGVNKLVAVPPTLFALDAGDRQAARRNQERDEDRPGLRLGNEDKDEGERPGRRIGQAIQNRRPLGIRVDQDAVKGAPSFGQEQVESMANAAFVDKVYRHFNQPTWWAGEQGSAAGEFKHVRRLSKLNNFSVRDVSNANLGKIETAVLDLRAGRVLFVMLDPAQRISGQKELIPIPPMAVTKGSEKGMLTLSADKEKLNSAPSVDRANLRPQDVQRIDDPQFVKRVYDHFGKQVWFDANALSPTGFDQPRRYPDEN